MADSLQVETEQLGHSPEEEEEEESNLDYFYDEPGTLPGTLDLDADAPPPEMILIDYSDRHATRITITTPETCIPYLESDSVSWLNVNGLGNLETWQKMAKVFQLHPIALEDVVNMPQRPKVVQYEDRLIIIAWMVSLEPEAEELGREQISIVLGKHYIISVQEDPKDDCLKPVRDRIRYNQGIIRKQQVDYLAYCLLDTVIDGFFPVLEEYGERIEDLEDEVVFNPSPHTLKKIYKIRRELLTLRRAVWSHRDAINALIKTSGEFISPEIRVYLQDCYDHTIQVRDIVETYRELSSGLMDIYLSSMSNKMNEVMKLLTIISTIFIPLTFIVGVYGMNFNPDSSPLNMPELNWYYGYPTFWVVTVAIATWLVYFFWKRGWFENFAKTIDKNELP